MRKNSIDIRKDFIEIMEFLKENYENNSDYFFSVKEIASNTNKNIKFTEEVVCFLMERSMIVKKKGKFRLNISGVLYLQETLSKSKG